MFLNEAGEKALVSFSECERERASSSEFERMRACVSECERLRCIATRTVSEISRRVSRTFAFDKGVPLFNVLVWGQSSEHHPLSTLDRLRVVAPPC